MKFTEMMMAENLANADRFEPLDIQPDEMLMDAAPVEYGGEQQEMRKSMAEFGLDVTPVIGDVKGAYELPDDMRMAKELVEQGYDEGDIVSMGLGGALGSLSMMGLIPFAGTGADVLKKGVKETARQRLAGQTAEVLDKGLASRGRKTVSVEEAEFTGIPADKPTPKVYHGARSMQQPSQGDASAMINELNQMQDTYVEGRSEGVFDILRDKIVSKPDAVDPQVKMEDLVDVQNRTNFMSLPFVNKQGYVDIKEFKIEKNPEQKNEYFVKGYDLDKGNMEDVLGFITTDANGNISKDQLNNTLKRISDRVSGVDKTTTTRTRAEKIKQEGFEPFSDFKGETGLAGPVATGEHSELKDKMMSFSRDPLVSMKPGFGGGDTSNIIYADLPPELTRDMSVEEYMKAANLISGEERVLPKLEKGQIGYRLPKSIHLEAEEAIANPELLNPKVLSDNRRLEQKIQRGQDMVDDILKKKDTIYTDVQYPESAEGVRQMYNRTREVLNKLQSLGQFTEQYGARGTYDDLLESLLDPEKSSDFVDAIQMLPKNLPEGQRKKVATSMRSILNRIRVRGISGAKFKAQEVLSGISDKDLNEALFDTKRVGVKKKKMLDDAGLGIYMDGTLDLERLGYKDLKRLLFLGTQKMNRGGLASRR